MPNGLVRRQIIEEVLSVHQAVVGPKVITFGRLEEKLSSQLGDAPIDRWLREFELNALAPELWDPLGLPGIPEPKLTAELADRLGDGLDRLRLAGVSWDQLESLEPIDLAMNMSRVGRLYEKWLGPRDDIFSRRIKLLKALKEKTIKPFKILHQIQTIFCAHSQRLSPFEAELLKALAVHYDVDLRLYAPSWLIAEKITRSSYHRLALIKDLEANAPDRLSITFIEQDDNPNTELPDALRFASDNLLGPPIEGLAPDLSDELTILEAPTLYHEVEEIGRRLKAAIISGISPHRLAVAVPSLGAYLPAIEDVSRRFGLSFDFVKGAPLSEQPPVLAFLDLLSLWGSNWELSRLLKVIESPYFDFKIAKSPRYELLKAGILDDRASGGLNYNFEKIIDP
ncbi:MAG: hypothetical protein LBE31_02515, partial [Deltaproteobacteria bacterium]|nr:hypothetical protein [Deltaproteobacteria bacterium]